MPWAFSDGPDNAEILSDNGFAVALMMFRGFDRNGDIADIDGKANADLIVRAVNSFVENQRTIAALVEALDKAACRFLDESLRSGVAGYPKDAERMRGFADEAAAALAAAKVNL